MDEQEFDSRMPLRRFRSEDAMRAEAQIRHCATLGIALWGTTSGDLQRQLLAPHPEIPLGFDLADLRQLQRSAQEDSNPSERSAKHLVIAFVAFLRNDCGGD